MDVPDWIDLNRRFHSTLERTLGSGDRVKRNAVLAVQRILGFRHVS
jgi:hypothetical protein